MIVEELIECLQKTPRDFEVYVSTYEKFGKPNQSKETIDIVVEMKTEIATIISQ